MSGKSTLGRRLRDLEFRLGPILFERTNGGTKPTAAGKEFLDSARRIVDEAEAMTIRFQTRSRGERGRLTIGVNASLTAGHLRILSVKIGLLHLLGKRKHV
jgi:DNA-binding transcriptional LysR family regulator